MLKFQSQNKEFQKFGFCTKWIKEVGGEGLPLLGEVGAKEEMRIEGEELRRRRAMVEESNESGVQAMEVSEVA